MDVKFIISDTFNESHEIVPEGHSQDPLQHLIDSEFKTGLILCIIESVSVGNISGIGTTHLRYIGMDEESIKPIIDKYLGIVDTVKKEMDGISTYFEWYQRENSYKIDGENKNCKSLRPLPSRWAVKDVKNDKKYAFENYIQNRNVDLSDAYIRTYLTHYLDLIMAQEWFNTFRYFTIIVKPISVYDKESLSYMPLGNLYLHFGANERWDDSFYRKLVNKILIVWFKENGATVLREIDKKSNTGSEEEADNQIPPFFNSKQHRKKLGYLYKNRFEKFTLEDLYKEAFNQTNYNSEKQANLIDPQSHIFKEIPNLLANRDTSNMSITNENIIETIREKTYNMRGASLEKYQIIDKETMTDFFKILSKRRIALSCLFVFDLTKDESHKAIVSGDKIDDLTTSKSREVYLWNNLFIPQGTKTKIYDLLSKREKEFLRDLNSEVKRLLPSYKNTLDIILKKNI